MHIWQIILLSVIQGMAELLPVSSSAHVVVAEKLMGLDPSAPQLTLLLVMLHTGTMFAVIVYFWNQWRHTFFSTREAFKRFVIFIVAASLPTAVVGEVLIKLIEHALARRHQKAEVELLFSHLELIAPALLAAGILILIAGIHSHRRKGPERPLGAFSSIVVGIVQGLAIPFRGFSRSGGTISAGLLMDVEKKQNEAFSFALAVVLTPPAIAREVWRMAKDHSAAHVSMSAGMEVGFLGMVFAFFAGLLALKWLSKWLESGRWYLFVIYCIAASIAVFTVWRAGF